MCHFKRFKILSWIGAKSHVNIKTPKNSKKNLFVKCVENNTNIIQDYLTKGKYKTIDYL